MSDTTAVIFGDCARCDGSGEDHFGVLHLPLVDDRTPDYSKRRPHDKHEHGFTVVTCWDCKGLKGPDGKSYARYTDTWDTYGKAYKNASTLKAALTRGKATVCKKCAGIGEVAELAAIHDCYQCRGTGQDVSAFAGGDVFPDDFQLTRNMPKALAQVWAQQVPVIIQRHGDKVLSTGASLLGLGTVVTIVDYGSAFEANDDAALSAKAREHLGSGPQWCHLVSKSDRRVPEAVLVSVTRSGWTITTKASVESAQRALLPPTYTAAVLNAPYGDNF